MRKLYIFAFSGIVLLMNSCTLLQDTSIEPQKYLGDKSNPAEIYSSESKGIIYSPFEIRIESPEKIILFDFKGHPKYKFVEFQFYNDPQFGKGIVCMLMRHDSRLDIYRTEGVNMKQQLYYFDSLQYSIPINTFDPDITFTFDQGQIDFNAEFTDKYGNKVSASLSGNYPAFHDFLVPVGKINPYHSDYIMFPLWYMHKLDFLNTKNGNAQILINDTVYPIKLMPGLVNWKRCYFARWSFDPVFCIWNKNFSQSSKGIHEDSINAKSRITYELVKNNNYSETRKIIFRESGHIAELEFVPALPEYFCLKDKIVLEGRFSSNIDGKEGIIGGEYIVRRNGDIISLLIKPKKGWQPIPGKSWVKSFFLDIEMKKINKTEVEINSKWHSYK